LLYKNHLQVFQTFFFQVALKRQKLITPKPHSPNLTATLPEVTDFQDLLLRKFSGGRAIAARNTHPLGLPGGNRVGSTRIP
jgi:hypothetical protein